jgi:hypothetical protein
MLTFAALCIPIDAVLEYDTGASPRLHLRFVWLFGLVKREIARPAPRFGPRSVLGLWRQARLVHEVKQLVRDVFARTRVRQMSVDVRLGLGDPYATGMACAAAATVTPLAGLLPACCRFSVEPSFTERVFRARLRSDLRFRPVRMVVPAARFGLSPEGRRILRRYFGRRRSRRVRPASASGR